MEKTVNSYSNVLIGTPVKNSKPYLETYAHQLVRLDYPKEKITIVIIENDSEDKTWEFLNQKIAPFLKKFPYRAVHLEKRDLGFHLSHFSRHRKETYIKRQECIDRTRQHIIDKYLKDNNYILWFDSDFEQVMPQALNIAISYNADVVIHYLRLKDSTMYDTSTLSEGRFIGKLIQEDRQKETWKIEKTNCHFLFHRRVFDRGYIYWSGNTPTTDIEWMKYRRERQKNSVYTFTGKNINAIFTKKILTLHKMIGGTQPVKRR